VSSKHSKAGAGFFLLNAFRAPQESEQEMELEGSGTRPTAQGSKIEFDKTVQNL
jgi:hypothetical protein